jgi:hypothetical protein
MLEETGVVRVAVEPAITGEVTKARTVETTSQRTMDLRMLNSPFVFSRALLKKYWTYR